MKKSFIIFTKNHFFIYDGDTNTTVCFSNNTDDMEINVNSLLRAIKDKDVTAPVVMQIHNNIADMSFTVQGPMSMRTAINHYGNWSESPVLYMVTPALQQIITA